MNVPKGCAVELAAKAKAAVGIPILLGDDPDIIEACAVSAAFSLLLFVCFINPKLKKCIERGKKEL